MPCSALGARPGDRLYVSGTIGDAVSRPSPAARSRACRRMGLGGTGHDLSHRPLPHAPSRATALALLVRNFARAAIDVSDGLVGDLAQLAQVSAVGASIETARVPFSSAARKALKREPELLATLLTGGDDYEIVAAVRRGERRGFRGRGSGERRAVSMIGQASRECRRGEGGGPDGRRWPLERSGFAPF